MKYSILYSVFIGTIVGLSIGIYLFIDLAKELSTELQSRQIQIIVLEGYKQAYMEHIAFCDTLHKNCFRFPNSK